ncbi:MAG: glycosyltransferase family 39 protein, partial [Candidatus Omnitrophota bacterium]
MTHKARAGTANIVQVLTVTAILALAFVMRLIFINELSKSIFAVPFSLDEEFYDAWGMSIAGGQLLGKSVFYALPLYPYFVGAVYWLFGHSLYALRFIQIMIGTVNCLLVYLIGKRVFSAKTGFLAALLCSLYGFLILHEGQLLGVTLAIFLNLCAILMLMRAFSDGRKTWFLISGLVIGLSSLTMAGILMALPLIIFSIFRFPDKKRAPGAVSALLIIGVLAPISLSTLHNYLAEKDFVPITAHGGITFYTGNNPGAKPYFSSIPEIHGSDIRSFTQGAKNVAESSEKRPLKPSEVSRYWSRRAFAFITGQPVDYIILLSKKFLFFFNSAELQDVLVDYSALKQYTPVLRFAVFGFGFIMPFAILGICLNPRAEPKLFILYSYIT